MVRLMLQDSTGHQLGVEGTSCVALAVPQFPLVHPAGCKRVRAGHARVVAGQSRSRWGLRGTEEEEAGWLWYTR